MPRPPSQPVIQGPEAFLSAIRNSGVALRQQYRGKPIELAERVGLLLPKKPVSIMVEQGLLYPDEAVEQFGADWDTPGLRELVEEVCLGTVDSAAVCGPRGGGKDLCISTPIATPTGWKPIGDIVAGDAVFAPDGSVTKVSVAWPYRRNRCYEVGFSDGSSMIAGEGHQWVVRRSWGASRVMKTSALADSHLTNRGEAMWMVDSTAPLDLPDQDLPIDPYWLGYWLGDGDSHQALISVGRDDVDELQALIGGRRFPDQNGNYRLRFTEMHRVLRATSLLGDKHIPRQYKRASRAQRMSLLSGLMDSDGTIRRDNNNCQLAVQNEALALGFAELVVSMGWKCTVRKKDVGPDWKRAVSYVASFRPTEQVFRLRRKADRLDLTVGQLSRHTSRSIRYVREVPSVTTRCIAVEHPSHMFLAGRQMIPTHNSQIVSFIEFYLTFIELFDALNLGGSELQADQVYRYLLSYIANDPYWKTLIVGGEPMRERTDLEDGCWIRVLTASSKSVRSPHAGGRKPSGRRAGGLLVIDEEAEAEEGIVSAALPTINTAEPSVNIRSSTFHNARGSFADLMENHQEMGYKLYGWDVFDICSGCTCTPGKCESPEPCFREDHTEKYVDPVDGQQLTRVVHKAYCGGKAKHAKGWMPMDEIVKLWRRIKRNHAVWEVEAMGSRPTSKGHVVKNMKKFQSNITDDPADTLYVPGWPTALVVDWGTVKAAVQVWQQQTGDRHVLLECEQIEEAGPSEIVAKLLQMVSLYRSTLVSVRGDIGGGGNYMNKLLEEQHGVHVEDVAFSEAKEAAVAALNVYNDAGSLVIPRQHDVFISQIGSWRRKNGHIVKGNDHTCDAAICYFSKFIDELGLNHIRVGPKAFRTGAVRDDTDAAPGSKTASALVGDHRVAVVRAFGSTGRR